MQTPRITRIARRVRSRAGVGSTSHARSWQAQIVATLAAAIILVAGLLGTQGSAQDASPPASPQASPALATPAAGTGSTYEIAVGEITIEITDDGFIPEHFESAVGRDVTITVVNNGTSQHTFTMEDFDIEITLEPGESDTVTIEQPELGTYTYTSNAGNDDDEGISGTMTIFI